MIRFRFRTRKAIAHAAERARLEGRVDVAALLGTMYLADKAHLADWGRPVFGGDYQAERIGPVSVQMRALLMGDPVGLCEAGLDHAPWTLSGRFLLPLPGVEFPDPLMELSNTDVIALRRARAEADESIGKSALRDRTLHDGAWSAARGGRVDYADMLREVIPEVTPTDLREMEEISWNLA